MGLETMVNDSINTRHNDIVIKCDVSSIKSRIDMYMLTVNSNYYTKVINTVTFIDI